MKIETNYQFACVNGYKGTFEQYITLNYKGYCEICRRCGFKPPLTQSQWLDGQES